MKKVEKTFEQLFKEFNDFIINSNRPDLVVNMKQFIDYYDESSIEGIEGIATWHLQTADRHKARKTGIYA